MRLAIVTTCTQRKSIREAGCVNLRDVPPRASVAERARRWGEYVRSVDLPSLRATDLYKGEHWKLSLATLQTARVQGFEASCWVMSAGYGLIPCEAQVKPYNATFAASSPDSITQGLAGNRSRHLRDWWKELAVLNLSDFPSRSLADLAASVDAMLILTSEDYLLATYDDCSAVAETLSDRFVVISAGAPQKLRAGLSGHVAPISAQFAKKFPLGSHEMSSLSTLNARSGDWLMNQLTRETFSARHVHALVQKESEALPAFAMPSGRPADDDEVRAYIRQRLSETPVLTETRLLRMLRDESGMACGSDRFKRLFFAEKAPVPPSQEP